MYISIRVAGIALAATSLVGCATVLRGTRQDYTIESTPSGATALLSTGQSCVTPCELHLKRGNSFNVRFELDGYQSGWVPVDSRFSGGGAGAVAGNILLGGIIGAGVDASNGSLNNLEPNPLQVVMALIGSSESSVYTDDDGNRMALRSDQFGPSQSAPAEAMAEGSFEPGIVAADAATVADASVPQDVPTATPAEGEVASDVASPVAAEVARDGNAQPATEADPAMSPTSPATTALDNDG